MALFGTSVGLHFPMCIRFRSLWIVLLLVVTLLMPKARGADSRQEVFEIGVLPYIGLNELVKAYGPLANFLEAESGRPVRIVTARDYADFLQKSLNGAYPLMVTASHFARLAEVEAGHIPLLRPATSYRVMVMVRSGAKAQRLAELRGGRVATPGLLAQTSMSGRSLLAAHGLVSAGDVTYVDTGNQKNALLDVINGTADACVISEGAFRHISDQDRQGLRELAPETPANLAIPVIYAASPKLPAVERKRWEQMIARFANETAEGRQWIKGLKYDSLHAPTRKDMTSLDADVAELKRLYDPGRWK